MKTIQRILGTFGAIVFLGAAVLMTKAFGFHLNVVIFDLVALLASAICGLSAWRGHLNEDQPFIIICKRVLFIIVSIVVSGVLYLLFLENM